MNPQNQGDGMNNIHIFESKAFSSRPRSKARAIVLGTNEIASAVAIYLTRFGCRVVMSHDVMPPVIRRGMAFYDALYGEPVAVENFWAVNCDHTVEIMAEFAQGSRVVVTRLGLSHLLPIGGFDLIVDARMHKVNVMPMLRHLAPSTIGLGPGFIAQENCDIAIETHPDFIGQIITSGGTLVADGVPSTLGNLREERFVYTDQAGRWSTPHEIGTRIYKGLSLGKLGNQEIKAPRDGVLRGIARDGSEMPANVKLVEIDPRGRNAQWTGLDVRSKTIAEAAVNAYVQMTSSLASLQR